MKIDKQGILFGIAGIVLTFVAIILIIAARTPAASTGPQASSPQIWGHARDQVAFDAHNFVAAQKVGNASDMALATNSAREHCHTAEGLGHGASTEESEVRQTCSAFGFPLP